MCRIIREFAIIRLRSFGLCVAAVALANFSCAPSVRRRDWSTYSGPGAEHFHKEEIEPLNFVDPIEPFNRFMTSFNNTLILGVVDPLGYGYRAIVPQPARAAITRFGNNLLFPRRALANLLQGKFAETTDETRRFLINSTVGVLGLFDVAATECHIPAHVGDFGQVLAKAGWKDSRYLCLPFYGPSTGRDAVGLIPDTLADPAAYFFPARPAFSFNEATDHVSAFRQLVHTSYDPYALFRLDWLLSRKGQISSATFVPSSSPAVQTVHGAYLTSEDIRGTTRLPNGSVRLPSNGKRLPFSYKLQPGRDVPLVFILPGLGAHRESAQATIIAELLYHEGYSVAIISSAFNWEFMRLGATTAVPGNTPVDAHDAYVALDAVARELDRRYPGRVGSRSLLGYSMGAFHAFYIAAQEQEPGNKLIHFDRYVTLDAPVRLAYGAEVLDSFYNAPLQFPPEERASRIQDTLTSALALGQKKLAPDQPLPFTEIEARFLVGLSFRLALQSVIYESQERHDMGVLLTKRTALWRGPAYQEILDYSTMEYAYAFLIPYYQERDPGLTDDELIEQNDLRSIGDALHRCGKIRHVANRDDFLVSEDDIQWLTETLGPENVTFLSHGGHLGNLYTPGYQQEILHALHRNGG